MGAGRAANRAFLSAVDDLLKAAAPTGSVRRGRASPQERKKLTLLKIPVSAKRLWRLTHLLDRRLYRCLRMLYEPIPAGAIKDMRENYSEQLPKTMRLRSADLERGDARRVADSLGITGLLNSEGLRLLGERITGQRLLPEPGCQVICYEAGDFSGPHNDHHPEESHLRNGYVDIHIMLSEPTVQSQLLVYEKRRGVLNAVEEVGRGMGIAVYELPFWHYTTPLIPRPGVRRARRWLLLASYIIERRRPKGRRPSRPAR